MGKSDEHMVFSPYLDFEREEWAKLRASTPLTLSEEDLSQLQGINESVSMDEVVEIYLPLSRLLNLHISATQDLHKVSSSFLGSLAKKTPYVIGIAGSVSVGKSTIARILQALLSRWPEHPKVALVTTDGFLYPNDVLEQRGIMNRKGFPGSYDLIEWFLSRFTTLSDTAFKDPRYYFHRFSEMPESEAVEIATNIWETINLVNLRENILPTRERAKLILWKGPQHAVGHISLRRI